MTSSPLEPAPRSQPLRTRGGWEGKVWVADDFDEPLPPNLVDASEKARPR